MSNWRSSLVFRYGIALVAVAAAHAIILASWRFIDPAITSVFLAAVIIASLYGGRGPGLFATVLATLDLNYTCARPYNSFALVYEDVLWLSVFLAIALLTSSLQSRRQRAEESLRKAHRDLEQRVLERTAELVGRERDILEISEREQERIGHDLHDGLGQELTGIAMLSVALAERLESGAHPAAPEADEVAELIHATIRHTRDLARGLCSVDLEESGLASALKQLAERIDRLPNVECTFADEGQVHPDAATASHLYRIAQEALNNAIRHGKAHHLAIILRALPDGMSLLVSDDGVGMPDQRAGDGMGMRLMSYRAKILRGFLDVRRGPAGGTVVECAVPGAGVGKHG